MKRRESIVIFFGAETTTKSSVVEDGDLEEMENEMKVITYKNSPVNYEFLNTILLALGSVEGEAESSGERLYLRSLIDKTEALMAKAYD